MADQPTRRGHHKRRKKGARSHFTERKNDELILQMENKERAARVTHISSRQALSLLLLYTQERSLKVTCAKCVSHWSWSSKSHEHKRACMHTCRPRNMDNVSFLPYNARNTLHSDTGWKQRSAEQIRCTRFAIQLQFRIKTVGIYICPWIRQSFWPLAFNSVKINNNSIVGSFLQS